MSEEDALALGTRRRIYQVIVHRRGSTCGSWSGRPGCLWGTYGTIWSTSRPTTW